MKYCLYLFLNSSETMILKEKRRSRFRTLQMDHLIGLLGIRRMDKVVVQSDERIDISVLCWFSHVERMKNYMILKRVYLGKCEYSCSVGRPRKRWIDTMKDCLRKMRFGCQVSKENSG